MARYMVFIYGDEAQWAGASQEWGEANEAGHRAFAQEAGSALVLCHELEPSSTAVTIRGDGSSAPATDDGPFVNAAHGIGGFYLLEAENLEQAVRLARQLPEASAAGSGVEVRAVR